MYFELYGLLQALKLNNAVQSRNRFTGHCMWQAVRSTCKSSLSLFSSLYLGIGVAGAKFWACEEFLPKFPQTCSQKSKESGLQKKSLHFLFGHHFCKINSHTAIFRRFAHFYQKKKNFAWILGDFGQIFTNSKFLVGASARFLFYCAGNKLHVPFATLLQEKIAEQKSCKRAKKTQIAK